MGLAASQSRFLLLTSRKNSLNSQMMNFTNQKMALQRQSSILAQNYQLQQNARNVTYQNAELDYASVMQPNAYGNNQMFTTSAGEVLLTNQKLSDLGLSGVQGSGKDFLNRYKTEDQFVKAMMPTYNKDRYTEGTVQAAANAAFKYDDTIMNDAYVNVSPATVLNAQGYYATGDDANTGEEQEAEEPTIQFAMGIQQDNVNSLACIHTLDQFQYTESNVHSVVNNFIIDSTNAMSQTFIDNFGASDAIQKALEYASTKTQEKFAKSQITQSSADIKILAEVASGQIDLDSLKNDPQKRVKTLCAYESVLKDGAAEFYANKMNVNSDYAAASAIVKYVRERAEADKIDLTDEEVQTLVSSIHENNYIGKSKNADGSDATKTDGLLLMWYMKEAGAAVPMNSTNIMVSTGDLVNRVTTGLSTSSTSYTESTYSGKDVYVNTSQITATFLSYFDAALCKALGTNEYLSYAKSIENRVDSSVDVIGVRDSLRETGLTWNGDGGTGLNKGATTQRVIVNNLVYTIRPGTKEEIPIYKDDGTIDEVNSREKGGLTVAELLSGPDVQGKTVSSTDPAQSDIGTTGNIVQKWGARLLIAAQWLAGLNTQYDDPNNTDKVNAIMGDDMSTLAALKSKYPGLQEEYEQTGIVSLYDEKTNLTYSFNGKAYTDSLPLKIKYTYGGNTEWEYKTGYSNATSYTSSHPTNDYSLNTGFTSSFFKGMGQRLGWTSHDSDFTHQCQGIFLKDPLEGYNWQSQPIYETYTDSEGNLDSSIVGTTSWMQDLDLKLTGFTISNNYPPGQEPKAWGGCVPKKADENIDGGELVFVTKTLEAGDTIYDRVYTDNLSGYLNKGSDDNNAGVYFECDSMGNRPCTKADGTEDTAEKERAASGDYSADLGNSWVSFTNNSSTAQTVSFWQARATTVTPAENAGDSGKTTTVSKDRQVIFDGTKAVLETGGTSVIGTIGNISLLSTSFSSGAAGIFGSLNQAGDDYKNFVNNTGYQGSASANVNDTYSVQYYKSLYSALAQGGWKVDGRVNDSTYLSQQMLYGNVVLNTFKGSSSWNALQISDANSGLSVVDNKEAQEKAKSEYEKQVSIIETKETFIDNQIETLKTQSDELETETDSLKTIIDAEMEKLKLWC